MTEWWKRKKEKTRKHRQDGRYTFGDFLMDVLFWIPEIIILPFRFLYWVARGLWKILDIS